MNRQEGGPNVWMGMNGFTIYSLHMYCQSQKLRHLKYIQNFGLKTSLKDDWFLVYLMKFFNYIEYIALNCSDYECCTGEDVEGRWHGQF